jgi:hypothetical protein
MNDGAEGLRSLVFAAGFPAGFISLCWTLQGLATPPTRQVGWIGTMIGQKSKRVRDLDDPIRSPQQLIHPTQAFDEIHNKNSFGSSSQTLALRLLHSKSILAPI